MYIYVLAVVITLGLHGNIICLIVFMIQRKSTKGNQKILFLLSWLSVADSMYLFSDIFGRYIHSWIMPDVNKARDALLWGDDL